MFHFTTATGANYTIGDGRVSCDSSSLEDLAGAVLLSVGAAEVGCRFSFTYRAANGEVRSTSTSPIVVIGRDRFIPTRVLNNRGVRVWLATDVCWRCRLRTDIGQIIAGQAPLSRIEGNSKYGYEPCCLSCDRQLRLEEEYELSLEGEYARYVCYGSAG